MNSVRDIIEGPGSTLPENGKTSSSPEPDPQSAPAGEVVCQDPENSDLPCPICAGAGVYTFDVPLSDPRFGKFQRCPNNPAQRDNYLQERLRRYGQLSAYRDKTFTSFSTAMIGGSYTQHVIQSLQRAKQRARKYAAQPKGWIVFEGKFGCGKTHLAVAIANDRLERYGRQVIFVTAPDLLDFLRIGIHSQTDTTYDDYFERVRNVSLLVLDDLGVENPSLWAKEKLFQLLNFRHAHRLPTVITTQTPFDELDPWLSSRMMDRQVVELIRINAPDYRRTTRARSLDTGFSNLQLYKEMSFDSFTTTSALRGESASLRRVKGAAANWAREPGNWLCILGDYGSGKTHLAAAIANRLHESGKEVLFYTITDLLDFLRVAFDPQSSARFDKRFHDIQNTPFLILDDLSLASATPWAKEKLFQIIDARYLAKSPTVFTVSETIERLEETAPRIATRLLDQRLCDVYALDGVRSYIDRLNSQS